MKYKNISSFQRHSPFFIVHFFEDAQRKTCQFNFAAPPILVKERLRLPGVCHSKLLAAFLPGRKARRHKPPFDTPLAYQLVHLFEHFRGLQLLRSKTPHDSDGHRSIESGSRSFAAYVSQRNSQLLRAIAQKLVEVPTNFPRGKVAGGHLQSIIFGRHRPEQSALNPFCRLQIALQPGLVARQLLIQPSIFKGNSKICRQDRKRLHVILCEIIRLRAFQIEHADDFPFVHHGNRQLRACLRVHHQVARIYGHIRYENWLL